MSFEFIKDSRYKAIVEKYVKALEHKQRQIELDVKSERIIGDARNSLDDILEQLETFHQTRLSEIDREKNRIIEAYKTRKAPEYDNPQAEMLRREDFNTEIALADDTELNDIVKDPNRNLSKYEINKLQLEFKSRGLSSYDLTSRTMDEGDPYESDPNYQKLVEEQLQLTHVKPKPNTFDNFLLTPNKEKDIPQFNLMTDLAGTTLDNEKVTEIKKAYEALTRQISNSDSYQSSFNPIYQKEVDSYKRDEKAKKYEDNDLRAVRDSEAYTLEDEYEYLKERYQDKGNKMYTLENPDYNVSMHLDYLRGEHEKYLEAHPDLKEHIESNLADETKENPIKEIEDELESLRNEKEQEEQANE